MQNPTLTGADAPGSAPDRGAAPTGSTPGAAPAPGSEESSSAGPAPLALAPAAVPAPRRDRIGTRITAVRAGQAGLDGETRLRRLLVTLLLASVVSWLVLALSGAFVGLVVAVLAAAAVTAAILIFGPGETDAAAPTGSELERVLTGQREEIDVLRQTLAGAEARAGLQTELARRQTGLLLRQLGRIDDLEAKETDPVALGELFGLDHLATRMRRHAEGVLVLSGGSVPRPVPAGAVDLSEVLRGAVAEIEDFSRVDVSLDRDVPLRGAAVADVVHLLAELIENATVFSSPASRVRVHGRALADGYEIAVTDLGVGMDPGRLGEIAALLGAEDPPLVAGPLGYQVVGRLAARHGILVVPGAVPEGGTQVVVTLPAALVEPVGATAPAAAPSYDLSPAAPLIPAPAEPEPGWPAEPAAVWDPPPATATVPTPAPTSASFLDAPSWEPAPETAWRPDAQPEPAAEVEPYHAPSYDEPLPGMPEQQVGTPVFAAAPVDDSGYALAWEAAALVPTPAVAPEPPARVAEPAPFVPPAVLESTAPPTPVAWAEMAPVEAYRGGESTPQDGSDPGAFAEPAYDPAYDPASHPASHPAYVAASDPSGAVAAEPVTAAGLARRVPLVNMAPEMPSSDPVAEQAEQLASQGIEQATAEPARAAALLSAYRGGMSMALQHEQFEPPAGQPEAHPDAADHRGDLPAPDPSGAP